MNTMNTIVLKNFKKLSPEEQEILIVLLLKMLEDYQLFASVLQ